MMKNKLYYPLFILSIIGSMLFLNSCQDVIEIELDDADKLYVIEGSVVENRDFILVRVTQTGNYFDTQPEATVNNALVKVTMPDNSEIILNSIGDGYYRADGLTIATSSTYKLKVEVDGKTFTSSTYMPAPVAIDSIATAVQDNPFSPPGDSTKYDVFILYQDVIGENYYRMNTWVNNEYLTTADEIMLIDDKLTDGNPIVIPIFVASFDLGDSVEIELQSIDEATYKYFTTFVSVAGAGAGSPFSAAPDNPETNIEGGALGVFAAYTSSKKSIVVEE
jgi:hypothetical protein